MSCHLNHLTISCLSVTWNNHCHLTCVGISSEVHIQSRAKEAEAQKLATMLSTTTGSRLELEKLALT